jgi:hypothetical protein
MILVLRITVGTDGFSVVTVRRIGLCYMSLYVLTVSVVLGTVSLRVSVLLVTVSSDGFSVT